MPQEADKREFGNLQQILAGADDFGFYDYGGCSDLPGDPCDKHRLLDPTVFVGGRWHGFGDILQCQWLSAVGRG